MKMKLLVSFINYHLLLISRKIRISFITKSAGNISDNSNIYFLKVSLPQKENLQFKTKLIISFRVK